MCVCAEAQSSGEWDAEAGLAPPAPLGATELLDSILHVNLHDFCHRFLADGVSSLSSAGQNGWPPCTHTFWTPCNAGQCRPLYTHQSISTAVQGSCLQLMLASHNANWPVTIIAHCICCIMVSCDHPKPFCCIVCACAGFAWLALIPLSNVQPVVQRTHDARKCSPVVSCIFWQCDRPHKGTHGIQIWIFCILFVPKAHGEIMSEVLKNGQTSSAVSLVGVACAGSILAV